MSANPKKRSAGEFEMNNKHAPEVERFNADSTFPPWVTAEHRARYDFAARYVQDLVVVDCACGTGLGTEVYLKAGASKIYAFDMDPGAVVQTRHRCSSTRAEVAVGDIVLLPLDAESVDIFVCLETIEHVQHDRAAIEEVFRVLKPGGLFICSTPNRRVGNPGLGRHRSPINPYHIREYSEEEFVSLLSGCFVIEELFGQSPRLRTYVQGLSAMAKVFGSWVAARFNQFCKLARFIKYDAAVASVVLRRDELEYEYFVALCRKAPR